MKGVLTLALFVFMILACSPDRSVQISGRVENGDSVVSIWVKDSIYNFPLDGDNFFSGEIPLEDPSYATLLHNSLNLFLKPGESLEIYANAQNLSGSLYFRGSLGGINSYMKEQELAVFFDRDYYSLDERSFVCRMQQLIDEKTELLEAKNFDDSFTRLEKDRICYSIADKVLFYPILRRRMESGYRPGKVFSDFLSSFSLDNEPLFNTRDYRLFLLNYVYLHAGLSGQAVTGYSDDLVDYILSAISNRTIKDFLLTEIVYRHIWENNGLAGADHLLQVFRRECSNPGKVSYIEDVVKNWERISPGRKAPDFQLTDVRNRKIQLDDFKGSYVCLTVWATWCVPCKSELPHLEGLMRDYAGRNIRFVTVAVGDEDNRSVWMNFLKGKRYPGLHTYADAAFNRDYLIVSVPRFILIGPDGNIVNSNAPRPSGQMRQYLNSLDI